MVLTGMDVAGVRQLAGQLRSGAEQLRQLVASVDSHVMHGSWLGQDADRFKQEWWPAHRGRLLQVAEDLDGLGRSAGNNADEQERVSANSGDDGATVTTSALLAGATNSAMLTAGISAGAWSALVTALHSGKSQQVAAVLRRCIKDPTVVLATQRSLERVWSTEASGGTVLAGVPLSYRAQAERYARVYATESVKLDKSGLAAETQVGAVLGVQAQASGHAGNSLVGADGRVYAEAQVAAQASAGATVGLDGESIGAHGQIGASIGAGGEARGHLSGVDAGLGAHAYAGVQAHADIKESVNLNEVTAHVDIGAALGLGAGVSFDVQVEPAQVGATVTHAAEHWRKGLPL